MPSPRLVFILSLAFLVAACGGANPPEQTVTPSNDTSNPFFVASDLPYGMPHFELIRDEHYVPAFERGMAEELSEVNAIAANADPATFDNTIVAMELTGQLLNRTQRVFSAMAGAHTNDNIKEIQQLMAPQFAAHADNILLNAELFARVNTLYQQRDELDLDPESLRLLERYYTNFVRAAFGHAQGQAKAEIGAILKAVQSLTVDQLIRLSTRQNGPEAQFP